MRYNGRVVFWGKGGLRDKGTEKEEGKGAERKEKRNKVTPLDVPSISVD